MRKLLTVILAFLPALGLAQTGVILPPGSNTLKSLHITGHPGLGIYEVSDGAMYIGNAEGGFVCGATGACYFSEPTLTTSYYGFYSTLSTNTPDAANAVWGVSNKVTFEGATANAFETSITPADPTAARTVTLADASGTVMLSALATNAPEAANSVTGGSNQLVFEGATANAFETLLTVTDPTADNTLTLPDHAGTVLISSTANEFDTSNSLWANTGSMVFEGSTTDAYETSVGVADPTADRTVTIPDQSGQVSMNPEIVADATVQFGSTVMPDASADDRFDVTTGSATLSIGVLAGTGPSAQATAYPVIMNGLAHFRPAEDQSFTRGHYLLQSATAGAVNDSATVSTDGLNIGLALRSEAVTAVIVHNGCTGGAGCINTALNTPNAGPAGQITLGVDVAALGWAVGQPVIYWNSGGTSPTGLTDGNVYWLLSVATTNVTIAASKGGAVVVPTDQGNDATQYLQRLPWGVVGIR